MVYITYSATEESLYFRFTEDSSLISGISAGVIWKDPNVLSHVETYPNPYTIGMGPGMKISYVLREKADITIRVFTLDGNFVLEKSFARGTIGGQPGLNDSFFWDGRNSRGRYVASGAYLMKIWVESDKGNVNLSKKIGISGGK
jgi:hypothetical protein